METKNIYQKLQILQEKGIALKKDANNPFFKKNYISLDNIIETYNPLLNELKLVCYHYTKDNKLVTVILSTEDESKIESEFNVLNTDPQKQGSEITYGKRYNLGQLLNIQTDTDDDANVASKAESKKEYKDDPNKPWIEQTNIDNLKKLISEWQHFSIKDVRDKYKVSKVNAELLATLGIN